MSDNIGQAKDSNFQAEVLDSELPVLVDFWAEWCGPCKSIAPLIEAVAETYQGRVKVMKCNVDENPETPPKYGIRGIPTLILFKDGEIKNTKVGMLTHSQLIAFIDQNI